MNSKQGITGTQAAIIIVIAVVIVAGGLASFTLLTPPRTQIVTQTQVQTQTETKVQTQTTTREVTTTVAPPPPPPKPVEFTNRTFTYILRALLRDLDPQFGGDRFAMPNIYERLVDNKNGTLVPRLATSWRSNADATEWTFNLRRNVKFHNGDTFDATAVKFSLDRLFLLNIGNAEGVREPIKEVAIVDPFTVKITTKYPVNLPLVLSANWSAWMVTPNAVRIAGVQNASRPLFDWFGKGNEIGTGPYVLQTQGFDPGKEFTLRRYNGYWGGWKPNQVDTIAYKVIRDNPNLVNNLLASGEADYVFGGMDLQFLPLFVNNPKAKVQQSPDASMIFLQFNTKKYPLNVTKVRQALLYAIPYEDIIQRGFSGFASYVPGFYSKAWPTYNPKLQSYNFNMTKAKQLLSEAGFPKGLGGVKLKVTWTPAQGAFFATYQEQFRGPWKDLGVEIETVSMATPQQTALAKSTNPQEVHMNNWGALYMSPFSMLKDRFGCNAFFNFAYWCNAEFDKLVDEAFRTEGIDSKKAVELYNKAEQVVLNEAVGIGLISKDLVMVIGGHWQGYRAEPATNGNIEIYDLTYIP